MNSTSRAPVPTPMRASGRALVVLLVVALLFGCTPSPDTDIVATHAAREHERIVEVIGTDGLDIVLDDLSISVPAGAAPAGTELIIESVMPRDEPVDELDDELFELATTMYDFSLSSGEQPAVPIEVSFPLPAETEPEHLAFVTLNSTTGYWEGIPVDVEDGVATVQLAHFSWGGFLFVRELWEALMDLSGSFLLGISDAPECYGEMLTLDGVVYSASSSSVLYHACVEEVDGEAELRIYNSGPYTWTLPEEEGLGRLNAPAQTPGTGLEAGDRVVTLLTQAIFSASDGAIAQLSPSSYVPLTLDAAEGSFDIAMEMDAGLSTLYMLLDAMAELLIGEAIGQIEEVLDTTEGVYSAMRCVYGVAQATQDARDVPEILNCLSTMMDAVHLDDGAQRRLSLGIAILASFGPKVTQMLTGAYVSLTGGAQGTVDVVASPLAPSAGGEADELPPITVFPECDSFSCRYADSLRIDHPARGELLLAMITRLDDTATASNWDGIDFAASGAIFVVDEAGRVTDLYGKSAEDLWITGVGTSTNDGSVAGGGTELERIAWNAFFYTGAASPEEAFHFHTPAIDAGGNILIASPGEMGAAAVTLRLDPEGYFAAPEVISMYTNDRIDWATIPEGAAPPTDYFDTFWGEADSAGLGTIELVSAGDEFGPRETRTSLRRDGSSWVYHG